MLLAILDVSVAFGCAEPSFSPEISSIQRVPELTFSLIATPQVSLPLLPLDPVLHLFLFPLIVTSTSINYSILSYLLSQTMKPLSYVS